MTSTSTAQGFRVVLRIRPAATGVGGSCVQVQEEPTPGGAGTRVTVRQSPAAAGPGADPAWTFPCVLSGVDPVEDARRLHTEALEPLVQAVLDGYHATLFAYGGTGAGKTYSLNSCQRHVVDTLFQAQNRGVLLGVQVSFVELYNETFRDLLAPVTVANLTLRQDAREGPLLEPLTRVTVRTAADTYRVLERGRQRRHTAATDVNEHSSRSHALVTFYVHTAATAARASGTPGPGPGATLTKLHLVDLAGSERQAVSQDPKRKQEAIHINVSLTALGQVILALAKREDFVPYRRSMLTRFLQDALGGQAVSVMLPHIRQEPAFVDTTLTTLRYAAQALRIENTPKRSTIQSVHDPSAVDILLPALPQWGTTPPPLVPGFDPRRRRQSLGDPVVSTMALNELRRGLRDQQQLWTAVATNPGETRADVLAAVQQRLQRALPYAESLVDSLEADIDRYRDTLDALQRVVQRKQLLVDLCVRADDRDWVDTHCEWVPTMRTYVVAMDKWHARHQGHTDLDPAPDTVPVPDNRTAHDPVDNNAVATKPDRVDLDTPNAPDPDPVSAPEPDTAAAPDPDTAAAPDPDTAAAPDPDTAFQNYQAAPALTATLLIDSVKSPHDIDLVEDMYHHAVHTGIISSSPLCTVEEVPVWSGASSFASAYLQ